MAHYQFHEIAIPGLTVKVLDAKPNGDCVHLGDAGCQIYDHRPQVCVAYDCRKQFKIMPRNDRRQFRNSLIWKEARKRLSSLDAEDLVELDDYRQRASAGFRRMLGART